MKTHNVPSAVALVMGFAISTPAAADIVADRGTVATPITSETSFSFGQYSVSRNFTDQYALHDRFVRDLLVTPPYADRVRLAGGPAT
jgi:hypothetical protein